MAPGPKKGLQMRKLLLTQILLCTYLIPHAQTNLDSLLGKWRDKTQPDSIRIQAYKDYIWEVYPFSRPDSVVHLSEALMTYAKEKKYPKAASVGYTIQGVVNSNQGNYPRALHCFQKGLAIQEKEDDKLGTAKTLNNIGLIFGKQKDFVRALEYYEKSLVVFENLADKKGMAGSLNNIANVYADQGKYSDALQYYDKSLNLKKELGDTWGIAKGLSNIGSVLIDKGDYAGAYEYYQKSLPVLEEIGDNQGLATDLVSIGRLYLKQNKLSPALKHCKRSYALSVKAGDLELQKKSCQCLFETYRGMGNGNEALKYMEKLRIIEDSLKVSETTKLLEQMEFAKAMQQDSIAKAEEARLIQEAHQAEVRKKNQTRNVLLATAVGLLIIAGGLYYRWRLVRKSRDIIAKEKDRSENLLLNILPADIAAELKEKGRADARDFDMVSILFTDFQGFTAAAEKLNAQDLVSEINTCFEAFDGIMSKYNVEKIKTIGDAYMAAGGLPIPSHDSVRNTVLAALEMQTFIAKRKAELDAAGKPGFEMRVGVHTGPVVAGIVGVKKFAFDVWGDTVNTASRMESSGEVGKVNISQSTYELLKDDPEFAFESRGKIEVKGKGEIGMYFVTPA